jgi:hypothetical protein
MRILLVPLAALALSACVAKTAIDTAVGVATLPVKVASAGVDAAITTQAEADQKRGARIRRQEECIGREERKARNQNREADYDRCEPKRD